MYLLKLILFAIVSIAELQLVKCNIIVKRIFTEQAVEQFYDVPAQFGPSLPAEGIKVFALQAIPLDGCSSQSSPILRNNENLMPTYDKKFVLIISRNNCSFEDKIRNAQNANYSAAIVYNYNSDDLEQMSAKSGGHDIKIPSVFVGASTGHYILDGYLYDSNFFLVINDELPFNINTHLILPFSILVGLCFIIMIVYVTYKCIMERRRLRQHRLPKRLLKKIPIIKFVEGHPYETCVICLEDYTKGERLRVLPCAHAYHCHCIDTWLTKNRRNCPICKRKVFVRSTANIARSRQASSDNTSDTDDDTQPLLNVINVTGNHGTFMNNHRISDIEPVTADEPVAVDDLNFLRDSTASSEPARNIFARIQNERLFRFLRRNNSSTNNENNPALDATINSNENSISIAVPQSSSNNILNLNLSGSFKDDDEPDIYESFDSSDSNNQIQINNTSSNRINNRSRREPHPSSSSSLPRNLHYSINDSSDVFIQTPSQGGIGVAALPNTNLINEQRDRRGTSSDRNNTRHSYFKLP